MAWGSQTQAIQKWSFYSVRDKARAYPKSDVRWRDPGAVINQQGSKPRNAVMWTTTWNVGTLIGKGAEIDWMKRRNDKVCCLEETHWKGAQAKQIGHGYKTLLKQRVKPSEWSRNCSNWTFEPKYHKCITKQSPYHDYNIVDWRIWPANTYYFSLHSANWLYGMRERRVLRELRRRTTQIRWWRGTGRWFEGSYRKRRIT